MDLAFKIAEANDTYPKWRLGCVIVKGGNILAVGQSKLRCNPAYCDFSTPGIKERVSVHAEQDALSRCGNPKGAILYIARVGRNGKAASSKPCESCQQFVLDSGIKRVYYLDQSGNMSAWPPTEL